MADERIWTAVAGIGAVLAIVAALAIAGVFGGGDDEPEPPADDFGAATQTQAVPAPAEAPPQPSVKRIDVGGAPDLIAAGAGYVWVGDSLAGTLRRLQPQSLRPVEVRAAGFPTDVSTGEGGAWLALPDRGAVQRVTVQGAGDPVEVRGFPFQIAAGEGSVWAMSQKTVERIDPSGGAGPPIQLGGAGASIAAGEGSVWVATGNREVVRISPEGELSDERADVAKVFNVTTGEEAAWALGADGVLTRLDPGTGRRAGKPVQTGRGTDVAAGLGYVWVTSDNGTVIRFDPESGAEVGVPIEVGREPIAIAIGEGAAWVAASGEGAVYRITP